MFRQRHWIIKKAFTCFTKSRPKRTILAEWIFHHGIHKTIISPIEETNKWNTGGGNFSRHLQTSATKNNQHNPKVTSHHTPHNWKWRWISPVHIVISHQYNLWHHLIPPDTPHPRRMEKYLHVASPRVSTITQSTSVLLPRVPTAWHQYNLRPKLQLAYSCTQTGKFLWPKISSQS